MLERVACMEQSLGIQISGVRLLWRIEITKVSLLAMRNDGRPVSTPAHRNTEKADLVVSLGSLPVLEVDGLRDITQIAPAVVVSDAVDVIYHASRPLASHVEPREAMRGVSVASDRDVGVSDALIDAADQLARLPASRVMQAREHAGFGFVVKKFAQTLRGKIGLSHDALQLLIGQRPAGVDSTARASSF